MAIGTFIAGRFSATYDPPGATAAADLGIMDNGYEIEASYSYELINDTDAYGDMVIDGIYRGGNVFLQGTSKEYKAGSLNAAFPFGAAAFAPTGSTYMGPGVIGRLISDVAGIIILTATAATPAASTPATLTITYGIFAENFNINLLLNSKLRRVPMRFRCLPYLDTVIKWLTAT